MSIDSLLGSDLGRALVERTRSALDELADSIAKELSQHGISNPGSEQQNIFSQILDQAVGDSEREGDASTAEATSGAIAGTATRSAPALGLAEGLASGTTNSGLLHVYRAGDSSLPWDGKGLNTAIEAYLDACLLPDATGLVRGQVAPGLEGWNELVQSDEDNRYHGYRDYLDKNYPGGYDAWNQAFDDYRRVALNGETLTIDIANTSGIDNLA
jgi:hypothetical protein